MTKITHKALNRKFERGEFGQGVLREKPLESIRKILCDCSRCFKPIYVAPGQLYGRDNDGGFSHKGCRKKKNYYGE